MSQVAVVHYPNVHFNYYCIIPHPTELQVLLLAGEDGWSLPSFVPYEHHFGMVGHINQSIKDQLGLNVTTLRCFYQDYCSDTNTRCRVYAMENHSLDSVLANATTNFSISNYTTLGCFVSRDRQLRNYSTSGTGSSLGD